METIHNTSTARLRSVLGVIGIVTAIICSLVFLKENHFSRRAEATLPAIEISNVVNTDLIETAVSILSFTHSNTTSW